MANHPQIQVKRIERDGELYVLTRSLARAEKERAMRQRVLKGLRKDLAKLSHAVRSGRIHRQELIYTRLGRLAERWPSAWSYLKELPSLRADWSGACGLISGSTIQKNSGVNTCS